MMKKSVFGVLLCVICFCVFYGIRYLENPVATQTAVSEVYENKIDTSGYIVRDEQVYNAPAAGTIYHYIQEGTRVKKNRVLSTVYSANVSEETLQELNNVSSKIEELLQSSAAGYTVAGVSNEEDIENIKNNIIKAKNSNDITKISDYKTQIKGIITGDIQSAQGDNLEQLKIRRQEIETSIQSSKNDIYSQIAGVFSKNVDGLETVLTPSSIMSYKLSDYNAVPEAVKENKSQAAAGQPVCKVVNNHTWYVMMTVDRETAKNLKTGRKVKLRFDYLPGIEADAVIEYISTEDGETNQNVVAVKCEQYKEGVFSLRFSKIELILESYEGYRVPVSAIRLSEDNQRGVIVNNMGKQIFKPCSVIYTDTVGQTAIITPLRGSANLLREYDNIVVGEK